VSPVGLSLVSETDIDFASALRDAQVDAALTISSHCRLKLQLLQRNHCVRLGSLVNDQRPMGESVVAGFNLAAISENKQGRHSNRGILLGNQLRAGNFDDLGSWGRLRLYCSDRLRLAVFADYHNRRWRGSFCVIGGEGRLPVNREKETISNKASSSATSVRGECSETRMRRRATLGLGRCCANQETGGRERNCEPLHVFMILPNTPMMNGHP